MITLLLQLFASCPFFAAATASSLSKTSPCTSSSPSTSRCPGRSYARLIGFSGWRWPGSGPGGDSLLCLHHRYVRQAA